MEECASFDLAALKARGAMCDGEVMRAKQEWHHNDEKIAEFTITIDLSRTSDAPCLKISGWAFDRAVYQRVAMAALPMRFGGYKWFMICPRTGSRCRRMILPPGGEVFASVKGWSACYHSQNEGPIERAHRAIRRMQTRRAAMSRYTRVPTRERLAERRWAMELFLDRVIDGLMSSVESGGRFSFGRVVRWAKADGEASFDRG